MPVFAQLYQQNWALARSNKKYNQNSIGFSQNLLYNIKDQ